MPRVTRNARRLESAAIAEMLRIEPGSTGGHHFGRDLRGRPRPSSGFVIVVEALLPPLAGESGFDGP